MVRLTDRPDMTLDVYRGRKTTIQQQQMFWDFFSGTVILICVNGALGPEDKNKLEITF